MSGEKIGSCGPREQTGEPQKRIEDAIWSALQAQDVYVDREMDMVDASGSGVDMAAVAAAVVERLGLTEETAYLPCMDSGGYPSMCDQRRWVSGWSVVGGEPDEH